VRERERAIGPLGRDSGHCALRPSAQCPVFFFFLYCMFYFYLFSVLKWLGLLCIFVKYETRLK
jgi:hypothetical protein